MNFTFVPFLITSRNKSCLIEWSTKVHMMNWCNYCLINGDFRIFFFLKIIMLLCRVYWTPEKWMLDFLLVAMELEFHLRSLLFHWCMFFSQTKRVLLVWLFYYCSADATSKGKTNMICISDDYNWVYPFRMFVCCFVLLLLFSYILHVLPAGIWYDGYSTLQIWQNA